MLQGMGAPNRRTGWILAALLAVGAGAAVTTFVVGASRSSPDPAPGTMPAGEPGPSAAASAREQVFISGSMVNLRETASTTATVVKQVPIGTGCVVEEKAVSGWWRIDCGDSQGWTKAELLSAERPTLELLLTLAGDSTRPVKERFDAALRATALDPEHAEARNLLWSLFAEQEQTQLESLLAREPGRRPLVHASVTCEGEGSTETCLQVVLEPPRTRVLRRHLVVHQSERLGKGVFVSTALESTTPPQFWVRTGTYEGDPTALDLQVLAQSRYVPSDTLRNALEKSSEAHEAMMIPSSIGVLTPEELQLASQLEGSWIGLTQQSGGLVIKHGCDGSADKINVRMLGEQVQIDLDSGPYGHALDVAGVQRARDGSITFRALTGDTLTYTSRRDGTHVSNWAFPEHAVFNGPFVDADHQDIFPVVEETGCDSQ
ncbi:hypothetical protein JRI60_49950 [Archangium violaceum]|uniref:hypothetical protein n=1 Tax=Archangium violaceum TaxID=83451 RepID=UPI00194FB4EE|nr:hypothetical protein [Archangium violaceum]QRN97002.1 hypothetical protein JRI60_49950 [Archangium violaceum]